MACTRKLSLLATLAAALCVTCVALGQRAPRAPHPPVASLVPNFYYNNLLDAKNFYVGELGFPVVYDGGWVVIVGVGPGMRIALVSSEKGALRAVKKKGAMLSIETNNLREWYEYVSRIRGIQWYPYDGQDPDHFKHGIQRHGNYAEFRILDPGGYIVEFYQWQWRG